MNAMKLTEAQRADLDPKVDGAIDRALAELRSAWNDSREHSPEEAALLEIITACNRAKDYLAGRAALRDGAK